MKFALMTKSTTFIIGPCATVLGWVMDAIFRFFNMFGIQSIALCIITFTVIMVLLMLPITVSQQKFMKINKLMQPEMRAIQDRYKGKTDNNSAAKQNAEIQALYDKYGVSPTGSCLPLLIQFPILLALYQCILNIPAYVTGIKEVFMNIVTPLMLQDGYIDKLATFAEAHKLTSYDYSDANRVVDLLYKLTSSEWEQLEQTFPSISDVISTNAASINHMNSFLGINLAETPWSNLLSVAILIPIAAGLLQYLTTKLMPTDTGSQGEMAQSMQTMNLMMPLMSVFFCFTLPAAVGLYWVASSGVRLLTMLGINNRMDKIDVNDMIRQNIEKKNKQRAKKGLPAINEQAMMNQIERNKRLAEREKQSGEYDKEKRDQAQAKSTEYYKSKSSNPGSIASRAKMVQDFNEKNSKKK